MLDEKAVTLGDLMNGDPGTILAFHDGSQHRASDIKISLVQSGSAPSPDPVVELKGEEE